MIQRNNAAHLKSIQSKRPLSRKPKNVKKVQKVRSSSTENQTLKKFLLNLCSIPKEVYKSSTFKGLRISWTPWSHSLCLGRISDLLKSLEIRWDGFWYNNAEGKFIMRVGWTNLQDHYVGQQIPRSFTTHQYYHHENNITETLTGWPSHRRNRNIWERFRFSYIAVPPPYHVCLILVL